MLAVPATAAPARFVAVVQYGTDHTDRGAVYTDGKHLWAEWPDGGSDVVMRDRRGWLWDEYGETVFHDARGRERTGTRLPILSRSESERP